jgi:two-component system, NarL family, response regulator DevR
MSAHPFMLTPDGIGQPAVDCIRLLLVDDHQIVLEGLKSILELEDDFCVVGEALEGRSAARMVDELNPDIVLLDLKLKGETGTDVCRMILDRRPEANVVILTTFLEEESIVDCIIAGAKAYVIKDVELEELKRIVRRVAQGLAVLDPQITQRVVRRMRQREVDRAQEDRLSHRQVEVLKLLAEGLTNKDIGRRLYLSESTVKYHVRQAMEALGVERRAELVREVVRRGILDL